jgi:hypothetical protein
MQEVGQTGIKRAKATKYRINEIIKGISKAAERSSSIWLQSTTNAAFQLLQVRRRPFLMKYFA